LPQHLLGPFALGDVAGDPPYLDDPPFLNDRGGGEFPGPPRARFGEDASLRDRRRLALNRPRKSAITVGKSSGWMRRAKGRCSQSATAHPVIRSNAGFRDVMSASVDSV
jgi:hypothetical protein